MTATATEKVTADIEHAKAALGLFVMPGDVTEIRVLNTGRTQTVSGYFDDLEKAAAEACSWSGRAAGVYFTMNPVNPALLARSNNRLQPNAKTTTCDTDVVKRTWLFLDFDAVRPAGISSNDAEHQMAMDRANACRHWLSARGWPDPIRADSGNGAHLYYRIDLPNDGDSRELIKNCLAALAFHFGDQHIAVDQTTFNAARITKVFGTLAAKGDNTIKRPHRVSGIIDGPDTPAIVSRELLVGLADTLPRVETQKHQSPPNGTSHNGKPFDVERWIIEHGLPVATHGQWNDGYKWILNPCPFNPDHTNRSAYILRMKSGAIAAGCHHNGCVGNDWRKLRAMYEPLPQQANSHQACGNHEQDRQEDDGQVIKPVPLRNLVASYPHLRPHVISGLLREGETVNVISTAKAGKSWFIADMAIAVATGDLWLGAFQTVQGKVLICDNELHPETIADRMQRVAAALQASECDYIDMIDVMHFRGRLKDIEQMAEVFADIKRGEYKLLIIDALYRTIPKGFDENSNADMAWFYNHIDAYANRLGAAFALIHHASKGSQAGKAITDVGSGAGAQSRATDTHLILRAHEQDDVAVLEAAVRSFPPVKPVCLKWDFPLWKPDVDIDPAALKGAAKRNTEAEKEKKRQVAIEANGLKVLNVMKLADKDNAGMTYTQLRRSSGLSDTRLGETIIALKGSEKVIEVPGEVTIGHGAKRAAQLLKRVDACSTSATSATSAENNGPVLLPLSGT